MSSCSAEKDGDGTCNAAAGGTCPSETEAHSETKSHCFPDGSCFDSILEAGKKYHDPSSISFVPMDIPKPFGESQELNPTDPENYTKTLQVLSKTHDYMVDLYQDDTAEVYRSHCKVNNKLCAFWAAIGECDANPAYMIVNCAPVCQTCDKLMFEHRCPYDDNAPSVWGPGDLNKMFERLTTEEYYIQKFQPTILSQPPEGPWIITLDNVATEEQCKRIIELGSYRGYERSTDVGEVKYDGTLESLKHDTRTSHNTWCLDECYDDEINQAVISNVENITGIPDGNSEYWQLLQYKETQHYADHHDYIPFHLQRFFGARMLTVFLYLNDVEEGGETHFGGLDITVKPKTGRAVVWPSVKDSDPRAKEPRTNHEALPVIKGIKYAANAWIHQRDFKDVFNKGCS